MRACLGADISGATEPTRLRSDFFRCSIALKPTAKYFAAWLYLRFQIRLRCPRCSKLLKVMTEHLALVPIHTKPKMGFAGLVMDSIKSVPIALDHATWSLTSHSARICHSISQGGLLGRIKLINHQTLVRIRGDDINLAGFLSGPPIRTADENTINAIMERQFLTCSWYPPYEATLFTMSPDLWAYDSISHAELLAP